MERGFMRGFLNRSQDNHQLYVDRERKAINRKVVMRASCATLTGQQDKPISTAAPRNNRPGMPFLPLYPGIDAHNSILSSTTSIKRQGLSL